MKGNEKVEYCLANLIVTFVNDFPRGMELKSLSGLGAILSA